MQIRLLLTTFVLFSLIGFSFGQQAQKGILDLRKGNLNGELLTLNGEWEFYWNELLSPEEIQSKQIKDYYPFPEIWNNGQSLEGKPLSAFGYGTYRLRLILSPDQKPALYIKHFYCAYNLFCDGKLIARNGEVSVYKENYEPGWTPLTITLHPGSDTVDIVLQISNFSHHKGGSREPILIGSKQLIESHANLILGYDLLLAGSLIMTGLFFLGLFFMGSREVFILYFSLFCLTFSYRVLGADDYVLNVMYPNMNWLLTLRLEYLSLFVPPIFFALYTHALFPEDSRYGILKAIGVISALFAIASLVTAPLIFTTFVTPYLFVLAMSILWSAWIYISAFRNNRPGAQFALLSSVVVLLTFFYKILDYVRWIMEIDLIPFLGYTFFFFFQSLILFFLFTSRLKKAKEEAEIASKSKSDFLSMMSHEIRTPMNAVIGLTNYLLEEKPEPGHAEILNTLRFSAKNLLVIINDILDFSKIEAKKIEFENQPVNLAELLSSLHHVFQPSVKEKNLQLIFDIDEQLPDYISCDPTRMSQVLTNLISNAVKFTSHGSITMKLSLIKQTKNEIVIKFEIRDTGIGIDADKLSEIFQSFTQASSSTTREFGGTGLGLAITKQLLDLQGVDLFVESEKGKGSVFYFVQVFQITDPTSITINLSTKKTSPEQRISAKILVVEDNEVNIMVVSKFLKKWGMEPIVARNGKEALEIYQSISGIDLILMDLQMPIMDGYEASRQFRIMGVEIPIIALTASTLLEEQNKIKNAGMNDFITKPFDPSNLYQKISESIQKRVQSS